MNATQTGIAASPSHCHGNALHLASLAQELHAALSALAPATPLQRLLTGTGTAHDELLLPRPVKGCRLVVALLGEQAQADQVRAALKISSGVLVEVHAEDVLVALVPEYPQHRRAQHAGLFTEQVLRVSPTALLGISGLLDQAEHLPAAMKDCEAAARLAPSLGRAVVRADEHWAEITLSHVRQALGPCIPLDNPVRRLREYDASTGSRLTDTVKTWLEHNCESHSAAAALHLHPNSLRYRLKRAQEVSGLRLDDARSRALTYVILADSGTAP